MYKTFYQPHSLAMSAADHREPTICSAPECYWSVPVAFAVVLWSVPVPLPSFCNVIVRYLINRGQLRNRIFMLLPLRILMLPQHKQGINHLQLNHFGLHQINRVFISMLCTTNKRIKITNKRYKISKWFTNCKAILIKYFSTIAIPPNQINIFVNCRTINTKNRSVVYGYLIIPRANPPLAHEQSSPLIWIGFEDQQLP